MTEKGKRRKPGLHKLGKVSLAAVILLLLMLGAFLAIYVASGKNHEENSMGQPGAGTEEQLSIYQDWSDAFFIGCRRGDREVFRYSVRINLLGELVPSLPGQHGAGRSIV